jgi:hypothetical protein
MTICVADYTSISTKPAFRQSLMCLLKAKLDAQFS